ncbi:hypothetical protein K2173_006261 [Erythroxylum novogranatense]|uniref:GDSL esterase/lipase n=1 Tax=Erythroxylum novogranatense TaxID=1862640 RepID=A0AAV8TDP4_9ROSI|nr:hypothetical protein K2173_006261 [Erythroxylum novogranatense]
MAERLTPAFFFLYFSMTLVALCMDEAGTKTVPAVFIFGDSTFDVGTNNFLNESTAKSNFPYNGIDYAFSIPTGRFSNGYNTADEIVRLLGFAISPPPFLSLVSHYSTFRQRILLGVNFASGGSGIFSSTGLGFGKVVSLAEQIQQFSTVHGNISEMLSPNATSRIFSQSLFLISTGSNDMFEFSAATLNRTTNVTASEFLQSLLSNYTNHLQNLYDLGARKFAIVSVPPIGCCPSPRAVLKSDVCIKEMNDLAVAFFVNIQALLKSWSSQFPGVTYSLANSYQMTSDVMENPLVFGMKEVKNACCGKGTFNGELPCDSRIDPTLCSNRREYLFWDLFHPTAAVSRLAALSMFGGSSRYVTPMNISQLVETNI